jgi:hypothetical protein
MRRRSIVWVENAELNPRPPCDLADDLDDDGT